MRYFRFVAIAVMILSIEIGFAQDAKVDFSGTWILDSDKSTSSSGPGGRHGMMASKMIVQQKEDSLVVESFRQNRDGEEVSTVYTYTLNGKECENDARFGTMVSIAEWSKDGKTLIIDSEMTMSRGDQEFTMESTSEWSLKESALTIESVRYTPMGEMKSTAVYEKEVIEE